MLAPRSTGVQSRAAVALFIAGIGGCAARQPAAYTYTCEPAASPSSLALHDYTVRLTGGDSTLARTREAYRLPAVPASQVRIVEDKSTCQRAARAYHRAVRGAAATPIARSVAVIRVGTTRYLVLDPAEREGEFEVTVIFDSDFTSLLAFNS